MTTTQKISITRIGLYESIIQLGPKLAPEVIKKGFDNGILNKKEVKHALEKVATKDQTLFAQITPEQRENLEKALQYLVLHSIKVRNNFENLLGRSTYEVVLADIDEKFPFGFTVNYTLLFMSDKQRTTFIEKLTSTIESSSLFTKELECSATS